MEELPDLDGLIAELDGERAEVVSKAVAKARKAAINPSNPAEIGFPRTLPVEIALETGSPDAIREAYHLTTEEWDTLHADPTFQVAVAKAREMVAKDGMSFKLKAQLQSEELLKTSWQLIHSHNEDVPPSVKADLIKFTVRAAGLDGSKDQVNNALANALQININLGG